MTRNTIYLAMRLEWGSSISEIVEFADGKIFYADANTQELQYYIGRSVIETLEIGDTILKNTETGEVKIR